MKKITFFLLAFFLINSLFAQQSQTFNFTFNHQALSVTDVERSAHFYETVLGLTPITNRTKIEGIRWFSLGEGKELHLISILPGEIKITKAVHFALTTNRFDNFVQYLDAANIVYSDWPGKTKTITTRADGIKQIYLQDPDGYWIEVNSVGVK